MPDLMTIIPIVIIVGCIIGIISAGYVKASPDKAYIISGLRKTPKVLIGKAGLKIPFLEKKDELNLQLIPIDVKTSSAVPTADYININVDAAVNVKVSSDSERLRLAAENFLNRPTEYIGQVAREVLEGNMREIVGKMNLEEMVSDRQKFAELVKENAEPDLAAMGLDIISFNVQNFVDENGVIENLGVDNIVKIQKKAAISRRKPWQGKKPTMQKFLLNWKLPMPKRWPRRTRPSFRPTQRENPRKHRLLRIHRLPRKKTN